MSTIDWGAVEEERQNLEASDKLVYNQKEIPNDGSIEVRILPPWKDSKTYFKGRTIKNLRAACKKHFCIHV